MKNTILFLIMTLLISSCNRSDDDIPIIDLSTDVFTVSHLGQEVLEIEIKTNTEYVVSIDQSEKNWIEQTSSTRSLREESIYLKVHKNLTPNRREVEVFVRTKDNLVSQKITVIQEGRVPGIYTDEELIELGNELNKTKVTRDIIVLSLYGTWDERVNKWTFIQRSDIDLNPDLVVNVNKKNLDNVEITLQGAIKNRWVPIGTLSEYGQSDIFFDDIFDGGEYKIINLLIDGEYDYSGLFGCINNATLKNINIVNGINMSTPQTKYYNASGSLVAYSTKSNIENITSNMIIFSKVKDKAGNIGGIIGESYDTNIDNNKYLNSVFILDREDDYVQNNIFGGGIIGYGYHVNVTNCITDNILFNVVGGDLGGVIGRADYSTIQNNNSRIALYTMNKDLHLQLQIGGIVGYADVCKLLHCKSSGVANVKGGRYFAIYGGILGSVVKNTDIVGCENYLEFKMSSDVDGWLGGVLGSVVASQISEISTNLVLASFNHANMDTNKAPNLYVGGIAGNGAATPIISCYNIGSLLLTNERTQGSLVSSTGAECIKKSYWLSGTAIDGLGFDREGLDSLYEKTDVEMKGQEVVNQLNNGILAWNKVSPDRIYQIKFAENLKGYPILGTD